MRILLVATALHKEFGGPPKAVVGAAISLADIGHQVEIIVCGQSQESVGMNYEFYDTLRNHGVCVRILTSQSTSIYGGIGSLAENLETLRRIKNFDVINLHALYNFQNLIAASFCMIKRKPFTLMPHGTLTRYQRRVHFVRKLIVNPIFFGLVLIPAKKIFVATQVEKDEINRTLRSKTKVVGLGVVVPKIRPLDLESRTDGETFNFLFLGRIAPKKRLDLAIDAFELLPENILNQSRLIICGDGDFSYVDSLRSRAERLSGSSKFIFRGWISGQEKSKILEDSDCFLLTSEDENFAIAAAEALASGVPCVLSNRVALAGIVDKYQAGKIFTNLTPIDVSKAMIEVFNSDKKTMRNRAIQASLELGWETVIAKWDYEFRTTAGA